MPTDRRERYRVDELHAWVQRVLEHYGMSPEDAHVGAGSVVDADLSGVETHGLANFGVHWHYVPGLRDGTVRATPRVEVLRESAVTAAWDAGRGFGPVIAYQAMSAAIGRARECGVGMVTVRNGCHFGASGYFARMAAQRHLVGVVMSHTMPAAVPPGGRDRVTGTNPLAVAVPIAGRAPFVLDMATTAVAGTKVQVAQREGRPVPPGWIVDAYGRTTMDPAAWAGLLPLGAGSDGGGHKGFGLGMVVDILSGVLSGTGSGLFASYGPDWRIGYWLAALRVDAFVDPAEFDREMVRMVDGIHAARPAPGSAGVLIPGERAAAARTARRRDGVPLDDAVVRTCHATADETGVPFPAAK